MFIQKSFDIVVGRHKLIDVCETHPTAQQPEPNFITNQFNCVCSRRHYQLDIQTQTGS